MRQNAKHIRALTGGFTLIELLVVVSIIALLLSIIVPSLRKAKVITGRITCQSKLRQIALATEMYKMENKNHYPPCVKPNANLDGFYYNDMWISLLTPYIANRNKTHSHHNADEIFRCSVKGQAFYTNPYYSNTVVTLFDYFSYAMNAHAETGWGDRYVVYGFYRQGKGGLTYSFSEREVTSTPKGKGSAEDFVLFFESHAPNLGVRSGSYTHWNTAHVEGSNIVNAAGGVEFWKIAPELENPKEYFRDRFTYWTRNYPNYHKRFLGPGYYYSDKFVPGGGRPR